MVDLGSVRETGLQHYVVKDANVIMERQFKDRERIFVFTGPDGSGRKDVADSIGATFGLKKVISFATRRAKPGERNGHDYHFVTHELFDQMALNGEFFECLSLNGDCYGTRRADVQHDYVEYGCVYLVLQPEGAEALKARYGDRVVTLFVYTDAAAALEPDDMRYWAHSDHTFENMDVAHTLFAVANTLEQYLQRNLVEID
jgi:guanylate kinase